MMTQTNLFGEEVSDESLVPILVQIKWKMKPSTHPEYGKFTYDIEGKAGPDVSSGCWFGGGGHCENREEVMQCIRDKIDWFKCYGRPIKTEIKEVNDFGTTRPDGEDDSGDGDGEAEDAYAEDGIYPPDDEGEDGGELSQPGGAEGETNRGDSKLEAGNP